MLSLETYVEGFRKALGSESFGDKTVRMDIDGVGSIHISGTDVTTDVEPADCVLVTDHATYDQMFGGQLDPTIAFGKGDLKMDGEMLVALQLPALFKKANS